MPPVVLANTARVEMIYFENAQERTNIFHVQVVGPGDPDLSDIADFFDSHDNTYGVPLRGVGTALHTIRVTNISDAVQAQFTKDITPARPGANVSTDTPGNVTSTVSWRSGFAGRSYRGRTYMVDTPSDNITTLETINGTRAAALGTWGQALITGLASIGHGLGVASFTHNALRGVISLVIDTILDSMRRRLPGRGR